MNYSIVATGAKPDEFGREMLFVRFQAPGGEVQEILYDGEDETPDGVVQWYLQQEEAKRKVRARMPDTIDTFGMWVKMDMTSRSHEELKQAYRNHMDALGYDVDAQMVAHRRPAAQRRPAERQAVAAKP